MENKGMDQANSKFFQAHSLTFIEMALSTDRVERIENPDGYGKRSGDCGDTVEIFLRKKKNIIESVSFCVQGCMNTTACCNSLAGMVEGRPIESAWHIGPDQIVDFLETLPEDHVHCAELAVGALYLALSDIKNA